MHTDISVGSRPSGWGLQLAGREGVVGDSAALSGETGAKSSALDLKSPPATGDPAPVLVDDAGAGGCGLLGSQDGYPDDSNEGRTSKAERKASCSFSIAATSAGCKFVEPRRGLSSLDMRSLTSRSRREQRVDGGLAVIIKSAQKSERK